jgi:hypothetical protein
VWFILGFLVAAAHVTWIPSLKPFGHLVFVSAQHSLVVTLFLIGSGLSRNALPVSVSRQASVDPSSSLGLMGSRA